MLPAITTTSLKIVRTEGQFVIAIVPYIALSGVWPYVVRQLEKDETLWNKGQTLQSLRYQIETEELTLWLVVKEGLMYMTFLTMFYDYPVARSLQVVWGMGDALEDYIAIALAGLEVFARQHKCTEIEVIGRDGWKKPLAPFGYVRTQTTFVKHIGSERLH